MWTTKAPDGTHPPASGHKTTWVLMVLALVAVLLLPDWTASGASRPIWLLALPIVLGLAGAVFALRGRHYWWALASAAWGFVLIQVLVVVITLAGGP